jgi:alkanesulfonate monooxygenase
MMQFATLPDGLNDFVTLVVPELQRRGLFRTEYAGTTLRDHLGLMRPANRYVA